MAKKKNRGAVKIYNLNESAQTRSGRIIQSAPPDPVDVSTEFRKILYQHLIELGRLQVEAEQMYHNRSSVITLALGMLAVAFVGLITEITYSNTIGAFITALVGFILSILWLLLEQRNQIYFSARGRVIEEIEKRVLEEYQLLGLKFPIFWGRITHDVSRMAKPIQRVSAPLIMRFIIPAVFAIFWILMTGHAIYVFFYDHPLENASSKAQHPKNHTIIQNNLPETPIQKQ